MANEDVAVLCAAATVDVVGGTPRFRRSRGLAAAITDNGRGDFTFTLESAVDPSSLVLSVVGHHKILASFTAQVTDAGIRVRGFDAASGALDNVGFSLIVYRIV